MFKKALILIIALPLLLSACGSKPGYMNEPADDGAYHYNNDDLGFNLTLPQEFIYYQTQRKEDPKGQYTDIEIFLPTSDRTFPQEVSGYVKPIVVRIYDQDAWQGMSEEDRAQFEKVGEKSGKVYALSFWKRFPDDWVKKWNEEMKQKIKSSFKAK